MAAVVVVIVQAQPACQCPGVCQHPLIFHKQRPLAVFNRRTVGDLVGGAILQRLLFPARADGEHVHTQGNHCAGFRGGVGNLDIPRLVFAALTLYEGFAGAPLEAAAMGQRYMAIGVFTNTIGAAATAPFRRRRAPNQRAAVLLGDPRFCSKVVVIAGGQA